MDGLLNKQDYAKKLTDIFSSSSQKSLTETIQDFNCAANDFKNFVEEETTKHEYSSIRFDLCPYEEQKYFVDTQLNNIHTLVIKSIYDKTGYVWNWGNVYGLVRDPEYAKVDKIDRKVVYPSFGTNRPIGDIAYTIWNGIQIIDLDIKNAGIADELKPILFEELSKYNWFLGISRSASRKSLHVWTKITPISTDFVARKAEYLCNFRHKYSYLYIILLKYKDTVGYMKEDIFQFIDMAMCKPQQGIFIPSDDAYLSTNFIDKRLDFAFEDTIDNGIESVNWIFHHDLKDIFAKLDWFNTETKNPIEVENVDVLSKDHNGKFNPKHYKHAQRWQLANTLTNIFGADKALDIMTKICKDTAYRELQGDVKTASIHNKPISEWAVKELNKFHGFDIKIKGLEDEMKAKMEKVEEEIKKDDTGTVDPLKVLTEKTSTIHLYIKKDQYLSDVKDDIIKNLGKITLLESAAGTGKTEMIKAMKSKTLLILPFTSTIKAKVESSETTKDWLYYYGNKRPDLTELLGEQSMAMTIDKFSKLNVIELDTANFKYIIIDESHLLFTSSYRDVMGPTIQRLANCKSKVIMMTGTPTGEKVFFPNITHIKVDKEDVREKKFTICLRPTTIEQTIDMTKDMAEQILLGKKILYPTNKGNLYYEQISGLIQQFMNQSPKARELKKFYYKKSNYGEDSMNSINIDKSVGDNDIIFCTTYLSVGVDICDADDFVVYFSEPFIAQDIEQFANRLRNKNLYIKLFLPKFTPGGELIDWWSVKPLNLSINKEEIVYVRDMIKTCNDMIERNDQESKYNPIIQSIIAGSKFFKYDEIEARYYIDETTYKLRVFEDRYSDYAKQLKVLMMSMKDFKYDVEKIDDSDKVIPEANRVALEEYMKTARQQHYCEETTQVFNFLDHVTEDNIDLYRELLKGNYEIFKSDEYKELRGDNNLYVESIEVLEKNTQIVLSLYRFYDCKTIRDIYEFCHDKKQNKINYAKLNRIRRLVSIEYNKQRNKIDFPIMKFLNDAHKFAEANPIVTQTQIAEWQANYAVKYANSIPDLVVQDTKYLEKIFELTKDLWGVVIVQSKPKGGKINIQSFELMWDRKDIPDNIYGDINTKEFLLQELIDNMKKVEDIELGDFDTKEKVDISTINDEIPNIVHEQFEYDIYSKLDKSNDRFMRKQENTNKIRPAIQKQEKETKEKPEDLVLFNED